MRCPFCKKDHDKVIDSRSANAGATVRRRRECLACKKRFTTYEKVEEITLYVIKKDGRRDVFDREKIKRGLLTSCKKRPVSLQTIEDIVNRIEIELYENYDREVKSTKIGDLVMRELKGVDHVAYVRFAAGRSSRTTSAATVQISVFFSCKLSLPVSSADRSRMSLISERRWLPLWRTISRFSRASELSGPSTSLSKTSVKPRIAFSGVRSSWLSAARKSARSFS